MLGLSNAHFGDSRALEFRAMSVPLFFVRKLTKLRWSNCALASSCATGSMVRKDGFTLFMKWNGG